MSRGTYQREFVSGMRGLDERLSRLTSHQAVAYGVATLGKAAVVSKEKLPHYRNAISRTRDNFLYPDPAVMFLDYDAPEGAKALSRDELREIILDALPELANVEMLWRPSASSCIYDSDGNELVGVTGQRLYFAVDQGSVIPEIGKILECRLWLKGHGRIDLSRSGAMLKRCPVDTTVWQPERLDFAAGAVCAPPLKRCPVRSHIWEGASCFV
jgi:hypothetical protein